MSIRDTLKSIWDKAGAGEVKSLTSPDNAEAMQEELKPEANLLGWQPNSYPENPFGSIRTLDQANPTRDPMNRMPFEMGPVTPTPYPQPQFMEDFLPSPSPGAGEPFIPGRKRFNTIAEMEDYIKLALTTEVRLFTGMYMSPQNCGALQLVADRALSNLSREGIIRQYKVEVIPDTSAQMMKVQVTYSPSRELQQHHYTLALRSSPLDGLTKAYEERETVVKKLEGLNEVEKGWLDG